MGKILIYGMLDGIGGVERYVLNLSASAERPAERYGYIILGSKTPYEAELKAYGVEYFFLTPKDVHLRKNIAETRELFKRLRPAYDTIYINTSGLFYPIPYLFAYNEGYRIILHSHLHLHLHLHLHSKLSEIMKYSIHYFNRSWINRLAVQRLACSTPAAEWLFGRLAKTAKIVPNAIDLDKFRFRAEVRSARRAEFQLSEDTILLGNVGRLSQLKNQRFLLEILKVCKTQGNKVKLLLVGDGEDEEMLKHAAEQDQITEDVIFYGRSDRPQELLCAMDCFVIPSLREGFPFTLVEAQASGLPCFASKEISKEVNVSGNVTFLSLEDRPDQWAERLMNANLKRYDCMELLREKGYDVHGMEERVYNLLKEERIK